MKTTRVTFAMPFTYDANGNTLTKANASGTTQYGWDFENRLTQAVVPGVGTTTFRYDPLGRRVHKSGPNGTANYVYDGPDAIEEVDASGNLLARYTQDMGMDEPLSALRSGNSAFYEADGLGSISSLSSSSGALANTYIYDSFGNVTSATGTASNPFQYTGREYDPETGLLYYRARYYNPVYGSLLERRPDGFRWWFQSL
jgi:RHS repeat-associated protein